MILSITAAENITAQMERKRRIDDDTAAYGEPWKKVSKDNLLCGLKKRYISIDVECVATGPRHDERSVALIAAVDEDERLLLKRKIKQDCKVYSYLSPLTGLQKGDLDDGVPLDIGIQEVKRALGPDVVLVGQSIQSDIKWLKLVKGIDYNDSVELSEMFKAYNPKYRNYSYWSLAHEANTLLGQGIGTRHDPETDAIASIKLFNKYYRKPALLEEAKQKLQSPNNRPPPSWAKRNDYKWEGVCLAGFLPSKCSCSAPSLRTD